MTTQNDLAAVSGALITALSNYGAGVKHGAIDEAVATSLDGIPDARERAKTMAARAMEIRRLTSTPNGSAPDGTAVRAALTKVSAERFPMIAPGLRMPAVVANFQADEKDTLRPPLPILFAR